MTPPDDPIAEAVEDMIAHDALSAFHRDFCDAIAREASRSMKICTCGLDGAIRKAADRLAAMGRHCDGCQEVVDHGPEGVMVERPWRNCPGIGRQTPQMFSVTVNPALPPDIVCVVHKGEVVATFRIGREKP